MLQPWDYHWLFWTKMILTRNHFLTAFAAYLFGWNPMKIWWKVSILIGLWLADGGLYWCYLLKNTWKRDARLVGISIVLLRWGFCFLMLYESMKCHDSFYFVIWRLAFVGIKLMSYIWLSQLKNRTAIDWFRMCVKKYPNNVMLVNCANDAEWTYTKVGV